MAILFDENGYLKPYEPIEMTLDDFEQTFVFNAQRKDIFNQIYDKNWHPQNSLNLYRWEMPYD